MTFKKGDKVRIINDNLAVYSVPKGTIGVVYQDDNPNPWVIWEKGTGNRRWATYDSDLELVGESPVKTNGRKIYRLKKGSIDLKKGTLFIEMCDDGDQDFIKYDIHRAEKNSQMFDREKVMNSPEWFEEVEITVEPKSKPKRQYKKRRKTHPGGGSEAVQLRRNRAYAMHLNGKSPKYIARELNISQSTVSRYLKEAVEV